MARYREQGFLLPVKVISADEARAAREQVEAIEAQHDGTWPRAQSLKSHFSSGIFGVYGYEQRQAPVVAKCHA